MWPLILRSTAYCALEAFTIDQVRKLNGKATGVSLAQWARAKKIKKTASGYAKTAA